MVALVVKYVVKDGEADVVAELVRRIAPLVHANEPGCVTWQAWQDREDPNVFHFHEVYRDEAALQAHRETAHFEKLVVGELRPRAVDREAATCDLVASTDA
jgi:autoinducer 2-degrading protein